MRKYVFSVITALLMIFQIIACPAAMAAAAEQQHPWNLIFHQAMAGANARGIQSGKNKTIAFTVKSYQTGDRIRFGLRNLYGKHPYQIGGLVFYKDGKRYDTTVNGKTSFEVPNQKKIYTDELPLAVKPGDILEVRMFFTNLIQDAGTTEPDAKQFDGDHTKDAVLPDEPFNLNKVIDKNIYNPIPTIESIEVRGTKPAKAIVAFGDSITAYNRWVAPLRERLYNQYGEKYDLVNSGINGNTLTMEMPVSLFYYMYGEQATKRLQRDVLDIPNLDTVIFALGTNDLAGLLGPTSAKTADDLIQGTKEIVKTMRAAGVRHIVALTLVPRMGATGYKESMNKERKKYNQWLLSTDIFDYVVDMDAVVRDPAKPDYYLEAYQRGDWIHPSIEGGQAMANAFGLAKLTGEQ